MQLFETMRLEDSCIPREEYHINRMMESSTQLKFNFKKQQWYELTQWIKSKYSKGIYRLKMSLNRNGKLDYVVVPLSDKRIFTAQKAQRPLHIEQSLIVNKTSERHHLEHNHDTDLVLFYDENGKILEFDIGNIMISEGNELYTPVYQHDFLLGCMRQSLIDQGKLKVKDIDIDEFETKLRKH